MNVKKEGYKVRCLNLGGRIDSIEWEPAYLRKDIEVLHKPIFKNHPGSHRHGENNRSRNELVL